MLFLRLEATFITQYQKTRITLFSYFKFLLLSFVRPYYFSQQLEALNSTLFPLFVLLVNFSVGVGFLIYQRYIEQPRISTVHQALSELIFLYPLILLGVIFAAILLHLLAVFLGGKGSFVQTVRGICYSSYSFLLLLIPGLSILGVFFGAFLLIVIFSKFQKYCLTMAFVTVAFPLLIIIGLLSALGFLNLSYILTTLSQVNHFNFL